ncbi:MAG TPA: choice-of-anchor Q domain-containing protein [Phnomibacter sp.]|nr:choice-of-anchor Q domain-containing protein [Phnomibacter sp.]
MFETDLNTCMKPFNTFFIFICIVCLGACKKDSIIVSPDASLITSTELVQFDTVFTTVGSVTQRFTIVNNNDQQLNISSIQLKGGAQSPFKINVNGNAGVQFSNMLMNSNDSMYVFVKLTIDPNNQLNPFIVTDSIEIGYNGNIKKVQLQAYGQNARFINGGHISSNTTWNNLLPYVIMKPLTIDTGITLSISEGTKIFCHATAPIIVHGTIKAQGKYYDSTRINFRGDRLDANYKDMPGTWPGIVFTNSSIANELHYTNILNAYQAVVASGGESLIPAKLQLHNCIIDNAYDIGLYAFNSSITATNCRITQVGNEGQPGVGGSNIIINGGGKYSFNHCTIATYANYYQNHKQAAVYISNAGGASSLPLQFSMDNSIIYGQGGLAENELVTHKEGNAAFTINLRNVLYKVKTDQANISFTNCIKNADPLFDTINTNLRQYNFRLRLGSPCIDAGITGGPATDLDGNGRPVGTKADMGCYEKQ